MAGSGTMPSESGVDVPYHIREHLPEELSHLPADLLFATNLRVHEFSYSFAALRRVEERDSLDDYIRFLYGDDWIQWPRSAIDAARSAHDDYVRVRRMQEDAMRWVQENRCPTPASSSSSTEVLRQQEQEAALPLPRRRASDVQREVCGLASSALVALASSQGHHGLPLPRRRADSS